MAAASSPKQKARHLRDQANQSIALEPTDDDNLSQLLSQIMEEEPPSPHSPQSSQELPRLGEPEEEPERKRHPRDAEESGA